MEAILPLAIFAALFLLPPTVWLIANYNRFASIRQHLRESWADIEVEMKRRYDLVPNLVETVRGYAAHERETLEQVAQLRSRALTNHGSPAEQAVDEAALAVGVGRLFAVAEAYPDLRADAHFLALQEELANTEDRIAASRRFYNANVRELNQLCDQFPTNLIAAWFGFTRADYYELASNAERVVPRVTVNQR